jgi:hypothetical protein
MSQKPTGRVSIGCSVRPARKRNLVGRLRHLANLPPPLGRCPGTFAARQLPWQHPSPGGSATVRPAQGFAWTEDLGGATLRLAVQTYTVAGSFTVSFDDGTTRTFTMDDGNGYAEQVSYRLIQPAE